MLRILLTSVFCLSSPLMTWGQSEKLKEDDSYQNGLRYLRDEVPDLAIRHFQESLRKHQNDNEIRPIVTVSLSQALVRAARQESDPVAAAALADSALQYLQAPDLLDREDSIFWAAQASLTLGRYREAVDLFARLAEAADPELRTLSQLARANLLAAMNRPHEAGELLTPLMASDHPRAAEEALLMRVSLLLSQGKLDEASKLLDSEITPDLPPSLQQYRHYLLAQTSLAKGENEDAAQRFAELVANPHHLSTTLRDGATLGQATALHAQGKQEDAAELLIGLVDNRPQSPLLDRAISQLLQWASTDEQLKTRFAERLQSWSEAPSLAEMTRTPAPGDSIGLLEVLVGGQEGEVVAHAAQTHPSLTGAAAPTERTAHALYYHALLLAEKNETKHIAYAQALLRRLRLEHPNHPLSYASLLETGRLHSATNRREAALLALLALEDATPSPLLQSEASKLIALLRFKEGDYAEAAAAFDRTAKLLAPDAALIAAENRGISLLRAHDDKAFGDLLNSIDPPEVILSLQLEQALYHAASLDGEAGTTLDRFLREHPTHHRVPEARLALAELALARDPHDFQMAQAQLDSIDLSQLNNTLALRHLLTRLRMAELTGDWSGAIAEANRFLDTREAVRLAPDIRIKLAEAYFQNGNLQRARIEFQRAARDQEGPLREVALFFDAKAALKLRAGNSLEEGIAQLRTVIAENGILANDARLLLVDTLIESDPNQALQELQPLLSNEQSQPSSIDALILAAEARRVRGQEGDYQEAIHLYDQVLARTDLSYALSNRFHSLKGLTYEQLGEPQSALETYYQVIHRDNLPAGEPVSEWFWFETCGFSALRLLEEGKRWRPMLQIAKKIAAAGGPRAEEAKRLANTIQLKHQIWDDDGNENRPGPEIP